MMLHQQENPLDWCSKKHGSKVKISLVGCGYWGPKLARNFSALEEVELQMLCDLEKKHLEQMQELYPHAKTTCDYTEVLSSGVDAVIVATPGKTHYLLVKAALEAGKHVLVEKPMTTSLAECEELSNIAREKNLILLVGHTFEYSTAVHTIKTILNSGELGKILYIDSVRGNFGTFRSDVNVIWDLAIHDISIIYFLLKKRPRAVSAYGKSCISQNKALSDVAVLILDFPGDILFTIRVSWIEPVKIRRMTVVGTEKILVYDDTAPNPVVVYAPTISDSYHLNNGSNFQSTYCDSQIQPYSVEKIESLRIEAQHFIDCIKGRAQPRSSSLVGMEVIRILEAAQYSISHNGIKTYLNA
jgi:predicted dehydrogenase